MKKSKRKSHTIAANMRAAASATGKTFALLQFIKNSGCVAFNANGTVNIPKLDDWCEKNKSAIAAFLEIPDLTREAAFEAQADRRRKEVMLLKLTGSLVPKEQPKRAFTAVAKIFLGRLYSLEDRFHLAFKIPREDIRKELDNVAAPLSPEEFERLMTEIAKNES